MASWFKTIWSPGLANLLLSISAGILITNNGYSMWKPVMGEFGKHNLEAKIVFKLAFKGWFIRIHCLRSRHLFSNGKMQDWAHTEREWVRMSNKQKYQMSVVKSQHLILSRVNVPWNWHISEESLIETMTKAMTDIGNI